MERERERERNINSLFSTLQLTTLVFLTKNPKQFISNHSQKMQAAKIQKKLMESGVSELEGTLLKDPTPFFCCAQNE